MLTLTQPGIESSWEIVKVTARSTDSLTVVRAQEGTSAASWASGSKAELRLTAGAKWSLANIDESITPTWTGSHTFNNPVTGASFVPTSSSVPANGLYLSGANAPAISSNGSVRLVFESGGNVRPGNIATQSLGTAAFPWSDVRSANGTFTATVTGGTFQPTTGVISGTGLFRPATDTWGLAAGGVEVLRGNASGVLIGTNTSSNNSRVGQKLAVVSVGTTSSDIGGLSLTTYNSGVTSGVTLDLQHANSAADGTLTAISAANFGLGAVVFRGSSGSTFSDGAVISAVSSAAWSSSSSPAELRFSTTAPGSTGSVDRMRINSTGVCIGGVSAVARLSVVSTDGGDGVNVVSWNTGYSVFGPNSGSSTGAAIALGYDTTNDCANLLALAPSVAWKPLHIFSADIFFKSNNGNTTAGIFSGQLALQVVGKGISIKEGSNAKMGVTTLVAGTVAVSTTAVTANSRILLTPQNASGNAGAVSVSARTPGTSFTISSTSATDTRDIAWIIFEPS